MTLWNKFGMLKLLNGLALALGPTLVIVCPLLVSVLAFVFFYMILPFNFRTSGATGDPASFDESFGDMLRKALHTAWSLYLLTCMAVHFYQAVTIDPNGPEDLFSDTLNQSEESESIVQEPADQNYDHEPTVCVKCGSEKAARTHHCSVCDRCVLHMDHHCPWINNCVGKYNHPSFYLFIGYICMACIYLIIMAFPLFYDGFISSVKYQMRWPFRKARGLFMFTWLVSCLVTLGLVPLFIWHTYLISTGQTTIEYYKNKVAQEILSQEVTQELLRRRAEHNDGDLSTLREVTLHQFDIEKIENLDIYCRHLEILFLQNNQIQKIENLGKLKELKYLQLAINNIKKIENLEACESLEKLDMTVNFIEDPLDVECLKDLEFFRELYLTGNPCTQKPGYREFVITTLPRLKVLDAKEIDVSERILARQVYPEIRERFLKEREERLNKNETGQPEVAPAAEEPSNPNNQEEDLEKKREEFQHKPVEHTPEARLQAARDLESLKQSSKPKPIEKRKAPGSDILFGPDGRVLQKNQGKWKFKFEETPKTWILDVEISKFIDTSLMDVDVHPTWIRVTIKGKYLQLLLPGDVKVDGVVCERSKLTGHLAVTMLKAKGDCSNVDIIEVRKEERRAKEQKAKEEKEAVEKAKKEAANRNRRYERLFDPKEAVNIQNIFEESRKAKISKPLQAGVIQDVKSTKTDVAIPGDFEDDPEVPPLC